MIIEESKILKEKLKNILNDKNLMNEVNEIDVNNDKPFTFTKKDRDVKEGNPIYTDSNKFGKSGTATAVISKNTLAIYTSENIKEDFIYNEVNANNRVYLYKVTPLYFFKNDIIPIGVLFEYETVDRKKKVSHCKFGFNIEKGKKISFNL